MIHELLIMNLFGQEMPDVPDVAILHCGMMPHMKMGIKLNNFKNCDDGFSGRILTYHDLSDRRDNKQAQVKEESEDEDAEHEQETRRLAEEEEQQVTSAILKLWYRLYRHNRERKQRRRKKD